MSSCFPKIVLVTVAMITIAATPYEDTRERFELVLPDGWTIVPQFGDVHGMVFQKALEARGRSGVATLIVHVDSFPASSVRELAEASERALLKEPNSERTREAKMKIAGSRALVRDYRVLISKQPKVEKLIRAHYFKAAGHYYLLHFEAVTRDFERIEEDTQRILKSFKAREKKVSDEELSYGAGEDGEAPNLSGRWVNDEGLLMVLGGDGSFALAEANGRYEVNANALTMIIPGQGRETFNYVFDGAQGTLTLSSPNLETPMVYRRATGTPRAAPKSKSNDTSSTLIGRWATPTASGALVLELRADRTFTMGSSSGQWSHTSDQLTLLRQGAPPLTYGYRREGERLALTGGDLDGEVVFSR